MSDPKAAATGAATQAVSNTGAGVINAAPSSTTDKAVGQVLPGNSGGPSVAELMRRIDELQAIVVAQMSGPQAMAATPTGIKTYYHRNPGSTIYVNKKGPSGENNSVVYSFGHDGSLTTDDEDVHAFLAPICDKPGVPIFSKENKSPDPDLQKAAQDVIESAARSIEKLGAEATKAR